MRIIKIIVVIISLWVVFYLFGVFVVYEDNGLPPLAAGIIFFLALIFSCALVIGNLILRRVLRAMSVSQLKHHLFICGLVFICASILFVKLVTILTAAGWVRTEAAAIQFLQQIHRNEAGFYLAKKRFANLNELVEAGLLPKKYQENQVVNGYRFSSSDVSSETFCIHADRVRKSVGDQDFNVSEDGEVRRIISETIGTVARGAGTLLTEDSE